jgi:hypothetical protein
MQAESQVPSIANKSRTLAPDSSKKCMTNQAESNVEVAPKKIVHQSQQKGKTSKSMIQSVGRMQWLQTSSHP